MRPEPFIRGFLAFRELIGAILSYGVILWAFTVGTASVVLALTERLPELGGVARSQFLLSMILGAILEIGGRLIVWLLGYNAMRRPARLP